MGHKTRRSEGSELKWLNIYLIGGEILEGAKVFNWQEDNERRV